jgi:hypothetical protein
MRLNMANLHKLRKHKYRVFYLDINRIPRKAQDFMNKAVALKYMNALLNKTICDSVVIKKI